MKELTLSEAIEALKAGKKVRTKGPNATPFCLNEKGEFRYADKSGKGDMWVHIGNSSICNCISDLEKIENAKCFILVEDPILDDVEREYLGNIIKPFRKKYRKMKISKYGLKDTDVCYIRIILEIKGKADECQEEIDLPYFRYDTMYKGMEIDRKYTLEELGL